MGYGVKHSNFSNYAQDGGFVTCARKNWCDKLLKDSLEMWTALRDHI